MLWLSGGDRRYRRQVGRRTTAARSAGSGACAALDGSLRTPNPYEESSIWLRKLPVRYGGRERTERGQPLRLASLGTASGRQPANFQLEGVTGLHMCPLESPCGAIESAADRLQCDGNSPETTNEGYRLPSPITRKPNGDSTCAGLGAERRNTCVESRTSVRTRVTRCPS